MTDADKKALRDAFWAMDVPAKDHPSWKCFQALAGKHGIDAGSILSKAEADPFYPRTGAWLDMERQLAASPLRRMMWKVAP